MLGLKLNHVSKRGHRKDFTVYFISDSALRNTLKSPDIGKSTGPRSSTGENRGRPMKTFIVLVLLCGKNIAVGSPSMEILNLMQKKLRSCKNFWGPVKLGFSIWLPVLWSGKGPKVFPILIHNDIFMFLKINSAQQGLTNWSLKNTATPMHIWYYLTEFCSRFIMCSGSL